MGIACAAAVLVVEGEWVATARGENFDNFTHSFREMCGELCVKSSPVMMLGEFEYYWMQIPCHI